MAASVDSKFQQALQDLQNYEQQTADYAKYGADKPWLFVKGDTWSGNPLNISGTKAGFNRAGPNEQYSVALTVKGTIADCMITKTQIDYMAMMERAFRTRHMSSVRGAMHAAGRHTAHGHAKGIWGANLLKWLQDVQAAGSL